MFCGWGHASENPALPTALAATNGRIAFMGPGAVAMSALGDKIASTLIAQSVGVPTVPWSGQGIKINFKETNEVDPAAFEASCVSTAEAAAELAESMGYPIMIKASEGGGGKGIRVVKELKQVASAFRQVSRASALARLGAHTQHWPEHVPMRLRAVPCRWPAKSQALRSS